MSDEQLVQIERREKYTDSEFWEMMTALNSRKWTNLLPSQLQIENLPTSRAKNLVTPAHAPVPDCLTCGACCTFFFAVGVEVTADVPPEIAWNVTDESGEIVVDCYLKRDAETLFCTALKLTEDGRMPCGIYENRPQTCRNFEAGSDKCHALRRIYGLEPFMSAEEMLDALQKTETNESESASADTIRDAKIVKRTADAFEIVAEMQNGSSQTIHVFDPSRETWRQFQFGGLTRAEARRLIESSGEAAKTDSGFYKGKI